jgi:hypothetical protein
MREILQEIISGKYEVIGYDLKIDLERIEAYFTLDSQLIEEKQL